MKQQDFIRDNPLIIQALRENQNKKADALMEAAEKMQFHFSPAFEQKMEKLIRAQRKPFYSLVSTRARKTVLALAAALILLIALMFSVAALRVPFVKFIVEAYEKFSSIIFEQSEPEVPLPVALDHIYEPEYVPEGYAFDEENAIAMNSLRFIKYIGEYDTIEFQQFALGTAMHTINTEGVPTEEVPIADDTIGIYYSNLGKQTLFWENSQCGFSITGYVEKEILLAMARSLKEK